jgi:UDP-glucose:(heptosyl)LPS alpha-1,3-glucosyltransferase
VAADAWTLLFVGSGFERKGLDTVIDALAISADRSSRLIVIGRGATQAFRERAARLAVDTRIAWLGPRHDVERWYAAADVVVLPSRYEPFGNVHLEALASGVPVVASAAAGGAEAIVDGQSGAVVDPRDARAVATALGRLRERNPDELTDAARRAAEPFTFAAQVDGFARIYHRIAPARRDFP